MYKYKDVTKEIESVDEMEIVEDIVRHLPKVEVIGAEKFKVCNFSFYKSVYTFFFIYYRLLSLASYPKTQSCGVPSWLPGLRLRQD